MIEALTAGLALWFFLEALDIAAGLRPRKGPR